MSQSMTDVLALQAFDPDGAIDQAAGDAGVDTRADFFRKAAVGGGAVLSSGAIMGMLPQLAAAKPSKKQDIAILNYALTLEYLEAAFYREAVGSGALSGPTLEFARLVAEHEQTHVEALRKTIRSLKGKTVKKPEFDFQGTNRQQGSFQSTALVLENTGVRAYLGQAARLKSKALLNAAASIVTIEARHAAAIALIINSSQLRGENGITPYGAFDRRSSKARILREVGATKFIKG